MKVTLLELKSIVLKKLSTIYDEGDSDKIAEVILSAELSGKYSHGLVRLLGPHFNQPNPEKYKKPEVKQLNANVTLIDGNKNSGMLVLSIGTEEAIKIGRENPVGIVGTINTFSTSGYITNYLRKITSAGLIGIIMARSENSVTGFDSKFPLFGTNPIGFGFPTKEGNFIFDFGTSIISYGGLMNLKQNGARLPEGIAFTKDGIPTTDPDEAMKGSVLTFDKSYKSSGLAMIVEILAGVFVGAAYGNDLKNNQWGNIIITIKPDLFIQADEFKSRLSEYIDFIQKNNADGRLPGELATETYNKSINQGFVEVDKDLINKIMQ